MRFTVQRAPSPVDDASPTGSADTVGDSSSRRDVSAVRRTSVGQQPTTGDDRRQLLGTFRRVDDERGSKAGVNDEKNDYAVVTTTIRLRFDGRSSAVRLLVKGH